MDATCRKGSRGPDATWPLPKGEVGCIYDAGGVLGSVGPQRNQAQETIPYTGDGGQNEAHYFPPQISTTSACSPNRLYIYSRPLEPAGYPSPDDAH